MKEGPYLEDGKGLSIQDVTPRGIMGAPTETPTKDNMKLTGIDFYHRYKEKTSGCLQRWGLKCSGLP